jgi:hypothetical protein
MPRNPDKTDYSQGFPEGFEVFVSINDPRDGGHTLHHFGEILFIAFAAVLCGVRSNELMEEFGELREDWLRKWLKRPNGIPCAGWPSTPTIACPSKARSARACPNANSAPPTTPTISNNSSP